jgi:tricarballylate dehydrogenase
LVNRDCNRFVDEAPGPIDLHYDQIARAIADQPGGIAYVIYDTSIEDVPNWKRSIRTEQPPVTAKTLEELASKLGLAPERLSAVVQTYNEACTGGDFKALEVDGLATKGLFPKKSNWARRIENGPFSAYPIISGICFTYGGVKTNAHAEVVDCDGRPIVGLYAAGEAAGLYYQVYTGSTSVMRGAVFGKLAGERAAALAQKQHTN